MGNSNFSYWITQSHVGRILLLGILILLLQFPISAIQDLVFERQATQQSAVDEVKQKWGKEQRIIGPLLVVPYQVKHLWKNEQTGKTESEILIERAVFFPETLNAKASLENETRYRGIFEVPLFQATVNLSGQFARPDFTPWEIKAENILWPKARLVVMVSDARAIQKQATISWNGAEYFFAPGTDPSTPDNEGYHVNLTKFGDSVDQYQFSIQLQLNGSGGIYFAPLGKDSEIKVDAPWPDPSFQGNWLPTSRHVSAEGFNSLWRIPYIGRNFPQQSQSFPAIAEKVNSANVGVDLITPIDNYRMTERSIKYVILFLFLTFSIIWLIEVLSKLRVHLVQYLLISSGLCLFYLLELSLSEHIGFYWAYAIAASAIVSMVAMYAYVVLRTGKRAMIIASSLSGMYLYLFSLLQEQNYALLIGSVVLFVLLGVVMYVTRNIDWFSLADFTKIKIANPAVE